MVCLRRASRVLCTICWSAWMSISSVRQWSLSVKQALTRVRHRRLWASDLLLNRGAVVGQFFVVHFEDFAPLVVEAAVLDLLDALVQPYGFLAKMGALCPADVQRDEVRRNVRDAHRRAHAAHDAVHEHFRDAFEITEDRLPDTLTHVDFLWTRFGAGIAIPTERRFRIEIEQILLRVLEL